MDHVKKWDVWAVRISFVAILAAVAAAFHPFVVSLPVAVAVGILFGGVVIALEPLNDRVDHPGYYLTSTTEGLDIVDEGGGRKSACFTISTMPA